MKMFELQLSFSSFFFFLSAASEISHQWASYELGFICDSSLFGEENIEFSYLKGIPKSDKILTDSLNR